MFKRENKEAIEELKDYEKRIKKMRDSEESDTKVVVDLLTGISKKVDMIYNTPQPKYIQNDVQANT